MSSRLTVMLHCIDGSMSIHGNLRFQIEFPLLVQTLAVGNGFGHVPPSIRLLSFIFMVFILVKTLVVRKVTTALSCCL